MRRQLRELVKFIYQQERRIFYTKFEYELTEVVETDVPIKQTGFSYYSDYLVVRFISFKVGILCSVISSLDN